MEIKGTKFRDRVHFSRQYPKCYDNNEIWMKLLNFSNKCCVVKFLRLKNLNLMVKSKLFYRGEGNLLSSSSRFVWRCHDSWNFIGMIEKDTKTWNGKFWCAHEKDSHALHLCGSNHRIVGIKFSLSNLSQLGQQQTSFCLVDMVHKENAVEMVKFMKHNSGKQSIHE